jgi:hypothetical protein
MELFLEILIIIPLSIIALSCLLFVYEGFKNRQYIKAYLAQHPSKESTYKPSPEAFEKKKENNWKNMRKAFRSPGSKGDLDE